MLIRQQSGLTSLRVDFQPTCIKLKFLRKMYWKELSVSSLCVAKVMIKKLVNWCLALYLCPLSPFRRLRGGTFSAGQPATCTSSQETFRGSWSSGSLECTFPAPPQPSSSLSLASSCSCWCHGRSPWVCAAGRSSAAVRTVGAWRRGPFSSACPGFGRWREGATAGWPARRWPSPGASWLLTGSRSWRWRARWRRCHSRPPHRLCGFCSSSHMEGRTNVMNHLERNREGTNISAYTDLFLSYFFCLSGLLIMKRKARHKEPQISQTGEEKQKKQTKRNVSKCQMTPRIKWQGNRDDWLASSLITKVSWLCHNPVRSENYPHRFTSHRKRRAL